MNSSDDKTGDASFPGYKGFHCHRPRQSAYGRPSGGVSVYVADRYAHLVTTYHQMHLEGIMWLKFHPSLLQTLDPVFLFACYFSPEGATFYDKSEVNVPFPALMEEIAKCSSQGSIVCCGDFNAHTSGLPDIVPIHQVLQAMANDVPLPEELLHHQIPNNIPTSRAHKDSHGVNEYGELLVDVCISADMVILNGRVKGDEQGSCSYPAVADAEATSCVDYWMASHNLYGQVASMSVIDSSIFPASKFSDHMPLVLQLLQGDHATSHHPPCPPEEHRRAKHIRWDPTLQPKYAEVIASSHVQLKLSFISRQLEEGVITEDDACKQLTEALFSAAATVMRVCSTAKKTHAMPKHACPSKIYAQDPDCQRMRRKIDELLLYGADSHLHEHMQKQYDKIKRRKKREAAKTALEQLLQSASHDPKTFWKLYHPRNAKCPIDDVAKWSTYFQTLLNSNPAPMQPVSEAASSSPTQTPNPEDFLAAEALNCPITLEEVQHALHKLKSNKSPDYDGIIPELLKYAFLNVTIAPKETCKVNFVAHHLLQVFNILFARGYFPVEWSMGVLVPVFKKGDPNVMDNYRGITVGSTFAKLFASILENRLHLWAESSGHRAQGQAGFRRGFQTVDNAFILQHMIDAAKSSPSGKLFVCFVDFKKAFDSIDRNILMQRLQQLGVHGSMFATLKSMYSHVSCSVRMHGRLGPSFASHTGVKQGCPLSPVLFGLLIDAIEAYFSKHLPGVGVSIAHALVQVLLYADDLALCASSADDLAAMLRVLENFCKEVSMEVNTAKTEIVIFRHEKTKVPLVHPGWHLFGSMLKVSDSFKYLGIHLHSTLGLKFAAKAMHAAGLKAMFALLQRCAALHITNPTIKLKLFRALVKPVLLYGSQLWGVTVSPPKPSGNPSAILQTWDNDMERLQFTFLRRISGVKKSTHRLVLLAEMDSEPLQLDFWVSVLKFWNRMCDMPHNRLLSCAFMADFQLALSGAQCWSGKVVNGLKASNLMWEVGPMPELFVVDDILRRWRRDIFVSPFMECRGSPRSHASKDVKLCTYASWFLDTSQPSLHLSLALPPSLHFMLMRFRMSSHCLLVEQGRAMCGAQRVSRLERVCPLCDLEVEDEMHFCLACPAYDELRLNCRDLFASALPVTNASMHAFMTQQNQRGIAHFLCAAFQLRQQILSTPKHMRSDIKGVDWQLDDFD
jgi:hypothetical protein